MTAITFARPAWLGLIGVAVLLAAGYVLAQRRRARYTVTLTTVDLLRSIMPRQPRWRRHVPAVLLVLGLIAVSLGLGRPVHQVRGPSIVVLAVDVSPSMTATDIAPSRFAAMKRFSQRFVERLPSNVLVGLVSFAETARVEAAPTLDHRRVTQQLSRLALRSNTSLTEAILASLNAIQSVVPRGLPAGIVMISDGGNDFGPTLQTGISAAVKDKISVSTIALGTPHGSINLGSGPIAVPIDDNDLSTTAHATHGLFFDATSAGALPNIYDHIQRSFPSKDVPASLQSWFLVAGFGLVVMAAAGSLIWLDRLP